MEAQATHKRGQQGPPSAYELPFGGSENPGVFLIEGAANTLTQKKLSQDLSLIDPRNGVRELHHDLWEGQSSVLQEQLYRLPDPGSKASA